ncbi:MAG: GNAT family N-acetyltransferase [Rhizobiales bacterium 65-9]|nr:MAG: GNAT family N-acetyltransferase [Rhizobiales bacterium 65-9]
MQTVAPASAEPSARGLHVRIARGPDDMMITVAIRAAVYMAEQDCPYAEEFDGNDACAAHFIGFVDGEPAGYIRARFFKDFVKLERLAVLKRFRKTTLAFKMVREGIAFARRKGFERIYGHAREGLEPFWARFGAKPLGEDRVLEFSDYRYTEMVIELKPDPKAITIDSGGHVIIRPEGDWDRPGVLDISAERTSSSANDNENVVRKRTATDSNAA